MKATPAIKKPKIKRPYRRGPIIRIVQMIEGFEEWTIECLNGKRRR